MIGALRRPGPAIGLTGLLVLGALLAARPASPEVADPPRAAARESRLAATARELDEALAALESELLVARAAARRGSALLLEGDGAPEPELEAAAGALEAARPEAGLAGTELTRTRGSLRSVASGSAGLPDAQPPTGEDLTGIAAQFRAAADVAAPHLQRRTAANETLRGLERALAALEADEPRAALGHLDEAAAARQVLAEWSEPPVVLDFWLDITGRLLDAARGIAEGSLAGDARAVERAAAAYAEAAEDAHRADVALGLALGETGAALTATPMRRLADALAAVVELRSAVALLLQPGQ